MVGFGDVWGGNRLGGCWGWRLSEIEKLETQRVNMGYLQLRQPTPPSRLRCGKWTRNVHARAAKIRSSWATWTRAVRSGTIELQPTKATAVAEEAKVRFPSSWPAGEHKVMECQFIFLIAFIIGGLLSSERLDPWQKET